MCARLDGSPLALELAAAWLRTLTPRQIEAGLDDRFALLVRSPRDAVPRHASLLASVAWSHDLLDEADRAVFRRLAVFAGGFDLDGGAGGVRGGGGRRRRARSRGSSTSRSWSRRTAARRYRLPETIREYAADRLRAAGERRAAADRHLDHRLARVRAPAPTSRRDKDRWRATLAPEHDNLRAAIEHGLEAEDPTRARELAAELPWLWQMHRPGPRGAWTCCGGRSPGRPTSARRCRRGCWSGIALVADTAGPLDVELDAAQPGGASSPSEHGDERLLSLCLRARGGRALLHRPRRGARDGARGRAARRRAGERSSSTPGRRCAGSSATCATSTRRRRRCWARPRSALVAPRGARRGLDARWRSCPAARC